MKDDIYTVDQVADILELHPKTVRRFIQEGKLKARKVGKQWRIQKSDLKTLIGDEQAGGQEENKAIELKDRTPISQKELRKYKEKVLVSAVVDVFAADKEEAIRLSNSILAVMNSKDPSYGPSRCDYVFYEEELKARFILWGTPAFIGTLLSSISLISDSRTA